MALKLSKKQKEEGWTVVRFEEIAKNISTREEPAETELDKYVGLEHLDPESLRITRWGVPSDVEGQKLRVKQGQIIFGKRRAYQKKVAIAPFDCICSAHAMVLEEIPGKIIPGLLPFLMQSEMFMDRAVAISEGSLSPTIKWKALAAQEFPLPPPERQRQILKVLQKVEECEDLTNLLLATVRKNKQLFQSDIMLNKDVSRVKFEKVVLSSAFGPRYPSDRYSSSGNVGTIRTTDFSSDSRINYKTIPLADLDLEQFSNHILENDDILITRSGTIGQVDVFKLQSIPIIAGAFQIRFRINQFALPEYVREALLLPSSQEQIKKLSNGGVQKNITSKSLLGVFIPLPSIDRQMVILKTLQLFQVEIELLNSRVNSYKKIRMHIFN